jgi:hypothetical protein
MVKVSFTYHFFDTWDNWDYPAATISEFAYGAFASQINPYTAPGQSNGFFQIGWRKPAINNFNLNGAGYTTFVAHGDFNARGSMVAQTSLDKFWIFFGSNLNGSPVNDESFGISNIEIWVK